MASATYITPAASFAVTGASSALFILQGGAFSELPMTKVDVKRGANITEITGSTDVYNRETPSDSTLNNGGQLRVASTYAGGATNATVGVSAFWRAGQVKSPIELFEGDSYAFRICIRRPGWRSAADAGLYMSPYLIIEDISMSLDPKVGAIEWSMSTRANGPLGKPFGDI